MDTTWLRDVRQMASDEDVEYSEEELETLLEAFGRTIAERLSAGESAEIPGLGRFELRDLEGRCGINPKQSGGHIWIESEMAVEFQPSRALSDAIDGSK